MKKKKKKKKKKKLDNNGNNIEKKLGEPPHPRQPRLSTADGERRGKKRRAALKRKKNVARVPRRVPGGRRTRAQPSTKTNGRHGTNKNKTKTRKKEKEWRRVRKVAFLLVRGDVSRNGRSKRATGVVIG